MNNLHRNILGTLSFDAQFTGMRKPQEWDVYPVSAGDPLASITIQSDTRIGTIELTTGLVRISPPNAGGTGFWGLRNVVEAGKLNAEQMLMLKAQLVATARPAPGSVIITDNSGAARALGGAL